MFCLADKFTETENYDCLGQATNCEFYCQGESWHVDCDRENPGPSEEWLKSILRDVKIRNIIG